MTITTWQTIWTVLVLILFVGICLWAWSGRRRKDFDAAARIPLDDDIPASSPEHEEPNNG